MSNVEKRFRAHLDRCQVPPGERVRLNRYPTSWDGKALRKKDRKHAFEMILTKGVKQLCEAQDLLYAADTWSLLLIFQAMDAAGKDSTIKHVMSGINPQGCQVYSFKHPSAEELDHTFLWRCMKALPERGRIGIFNRSYYEEVLIVKVHPQIVSAQHLPRSKPGKSFWNDRYDDINHFERHLVRNGTRILKFFLHVSKEEQRKRFLKRIDNPDKLWKFSPDDMEERNFWDDYMDAYEQCLSHTSTEWAPWHVVPADQKWVTRALVAAIIAQAVDSLGLKYPEVSKEMRKRVQVSETRLKREK